MFVLLGGEEWREWKLPLSLSVRSEFTRRMDNSAAVQTIWQICWILLTGTKSSCERKKKSHYRMAWQWAGGGGGGRYEGRSSICPPFTSVWKEATRQRRESFYSGLYSVRKRKDSQFLSKQKHFVMICFLFLFCFFALDWFIYQRFRGERGDDLSSVERISHKIIHIKM